MTEPAREGGIPAYAVRMSAFIRKEIFETVRQPRLILTLVLSPFLILLLFGLGFRGDARALRTVFVVDDVTGQIGSQVEQYASSLGPQLIFSGILTDEQEALLQLRQQQVDLVVVVPSDVYDQILNSEQAVFRLYHYEIDPFQVNYVGVFGRVYVNEVNRRLLRTITQEGQQSASSAQDLLVSARENADLLRQALARGEGAEARERLQALNENITAVESTIGFSIALLISLQRTFESRNMPQTQAIFETMADISDSIQQLSRIEQTLENYRLGMDEITDEVSALESNLAELDARLDTFQRIEPRVLVSPFRSEVTGISPTQPALSDFFAPSVIVLLLQHLTVTFAALSLVRERRLGTLELFRVSPLAAGEILAGKYLSYMLFGGVLALVLTPLLVLGLSVPMLGSWLLYALVVLALIFTSLGLGFIISLVAETDIQAVQYAMILLLVSVFFSGFLLSLDTLWEPIRVVSWSLPATYGIMLLRNIMLRGDLIHPPALYGLTAIGVFLAVVAWAMLRRLLQPN